MGTARIDNGVRMRAHPGRDLLFEPCWACRVRRECKPACLCGWARLYERLEQLQVTVGGPTHLRCHERCGERRKPGWLATVAQGHVRAASWRVVPGVGGLHRERTQVSAHDQSSPFLQLTH